jgi:hypothetical protein
VSKAVGTRRGGGQVDNVGRLLTATARPGFPRLCRFEGRAIWPLRDRPGNGDPHNFIHNCEAPFKAAEYLHKYRGLSSNEVNHHAHYMLTEDLDADEDALFEEVKEKLGPLMVKNKG